MTRPPVTGGPRVPTRSTMMTHSPDGACGSCVSPPGGGDQLGIGCTDTYGSGLNGGSGN